MDKELPYEKKAVELLNFLKDKFDDEKTIIVLLSCVIDHEEDVDEMLAYIHEKKHSKDDIVFKAFDIDDRRNGEE